MIVDVFCQVDHESIQLFDAKTNQMDFHVVLIPLKYFITHYQQILSLLQKFYTGFNEEHYKGNEFYYT